MLLHIASYYSGSKVHKNLVAALDNPGLDQTVYAAVRSPGAVGKNNIDFTNKGSKVIYRQILNLYTRLNFIYKRNKILKDLEQQIDPANVKSIHAHTLYSDGAVAYELFKKYNIPYIITVRSTDVIFFFKYFVHLRKLGKQILLNADSVVFLSTAYQDKLLQHSFFSDCVDIIKAKSLCIPNGLDKYWLDNLYPKQELGTPVNLLYVGELIKRKNIAILIDAVKALREAGGEYVLHIVGANGYYQKLVTQKAKANPGWIKYYGRINSQDELKGVYRGADIFIMPSVNETFGLVYIEALSQGLPVIYTKNEGFDGQADTDKVGEGLLAVNLKNIVSAINTVSDNYGSYEFDPEKITADFDWTKIATKYLSLYKLN